MTPLSTLRAGAAALALVASPVAAQFAPASTPTADALAAQMRQLGANPRDVFALIAAGELSAKLGDPAAALGFFGRAQAIEPTNPRIAAGKAGALVQLERPGEALLLYAQAERAGLSMTPYLAQRGLAYDLIGQPGYAQRDYRRALLTERDDETVRRLALSLGISRRRDEAMTLLDALLRRSDRAAWRARACILAVSGDVAGAQRIATSMMSGGAALSPFFSRLQWLSPADRAFAVHFGEVTASVARSNDARLAPVLAVLPVEPQLPSPAPVVVTDSRTPAARNARRNRRPGREPIAIAAAAPVPSPMLPEPPGPPVQLAARDPLPAAVFGGEALPQRQSTPSIVSMGSASTTRPAPGLTTLWAATPATSTLAAPVPRVDRPAVEIVTLPARRRAEPVAAPPPPPRPAPAPTPAPTAAAVTPPAATPPAAPPLPTAVVAQPAVVPAATPAAPLTSAEQSASTPSPVPIAPQSPPPPPSRTPEVARRNTALLASIIDTIAVPASELDVTPPARPAARKPVEAKADAAKADVKKPDPRKPEPGKPDPTKTEPARWWVQVAGGANAADLGKDWRRLTAKSPAAFRGRTAWTTPLRATNRLLAGPFKGQGEATAFVNALGKDGTSAFAWQSEAGQKISRLPAK